jgi:hypothetical protein
MLRGIVADVILDEVLRLMEMVSTAKYVREIKRDSLADAMYRLSESYAAAPDDIKSRQSFLVVFSVIHAGLAATSVVEAAVDPSSADYQMKSAVKEAQRTFRIIDALDSTTAKALVDAACEDYKVLRSVYGEHNEVIVGDPVDCFEGAGGDKRDGSAL